MHAAQRGVGCERGRSAATLPGANIVSAFRTSTAEAEMRPAPRSTAAANPSFSAARWGTPSPEKAQRAVAGAVVDHQKLQLHPGRRASRGTAATARLSSSWGSPRRRWGTSLVPPFRGQALQLLALVSLAGSGRYPAALELHRQLRGEFRALGRRRSSSAPVRPSTNSFLIGEGIGFGPLPGRLPSPPSLASATSP